MTDAVLSLDRIALARAKLATPQATRGRAWAGLGAAFLAAVSALTLAAAVILGPGFEAGATAGGPSIAVPR
jgi:hypothetical protein